MAEDKAVVPDQQILAGVFPGITLPEKQACDIITNTFSTCTFRLQLEGERPEGYPRDVIVRLEASEGHLAQVETFQHFGHLQLPDAVPEALDVGVAKDAGGRCFEYSVSAFVEGTTTLEDVWDSIPPGNQQSLMDSIVEAIGKLHKLDLQSEHVRQRRSHLKASPREFIGGPQGYHDNIGQLLEAFAGGVGSEKLGYEIKQLQSGISVRSVFDDIGTVELDQADLDALRDSLVLCHNDLEPRNVLVRKIPTDSDGNGDRYQVAAIIDWEMAGFYPFAYEFGLKDAVLGSSNLHFTWYSLFKERAACLVPDGECHTKLMKAMTIIGRSKGRARKRNVASRFQQKWIEREQLRLSGDARRGWVREDGAESRVFTKEDKDNLEHEVLKELGRI